MFYDGYFLRHFNPLFNSRLTLDALWFTRLLRNGSFLQQSFCNVRQTLKFKINRIEIFKYLQEICLDLFEVDAPELNWSTEETLRTDSD